MTASFIVLSPPWNGLLRFASRLRARHGYVLKRGSQIFFRLGRSMNHLLIGLGGTGGRVLTAFRKLKYRNLRDNEPDGVTLDYLFVDSDPRSFVDDDPAWTVLGHSVQLPKRSQLLIAQANLLSVVTTSTLSQTSSRGSATERPGEKSLPALASTRPAARNADWDASCSP